MYEVKELSLCLGLQGLPASSLQWGAWGGAGMASDVALVARLQRSGLRLVTPQLGLHALGIL